jgi:hypothetical protein
MQAQQCFTMTDMAFAEGQQVRVKSGHFRGTIARKLAFFDDMYVVMLDGKQTPQRKLAHESELEALMAEERLLA